MALIPETSCTPISAGDQGPWACIHAHEKGNLGLSLTPSLAWPACVRLFPRCQNVLGGVGVLLDWSLPAPLDYSQDRHHLPCQLKHSKIDCGISGWHSGAGGCLSTGGLLGERRGQQEGVPNSQVTSLSFPFHNLPLPPPKHRMSGSVLCRKESPALPGWGPGVRATRALTQAQSRAWVRRVEPGQGQQHEA
jgi:hypothetical protein